MRVCLQLAEALQSTTQSAAELSLQQKLREDSELRVEELEESLLEKEQELQRQLILISKLQGEVRPPPAADWLRCTQGDRHPFLLPCRCLGS